MTQNQIIGVIFKESLKDKFLKAGMYHKLHFSTYWDKRSNPIKIKGSKGAVV